MTRRMTLFGLLLLAACSTPGGNAVVANDTADTTPAKPFVPMTAAAIRKLLPGHYIDTGPYTCFDGPIMILADGTFETISESSGRTSGKYAISDGAILFDDQGAPEHYYVTIRMFRDQRNRPYYRYDGDTEGPYPVVLKPVDAKLFDKLCDTPEAANEVLAD